MHLDVGSNAPSGPTQSTKPGEWSGFQSILDCTSIFGGCGVLDAAEACLASAGHGFDGGWCGHDGNHAPHGSLQADGVALAAASCDPQPSPPIAGARLRKPRQQFPISCLQNRINGTLSESCVILYSLGGDCLERGSAAAYQPLWAPFKLVPECTGKLVCSERTY